MIVKINGTEVHRLTTKEVLKRLRLSNEAVELELRRDSKIKSHVNKYLAAPNSPSSPSRIAVAYNNKDKDVKDMNTSNKVRNTMSEPLCRPSRIPTPISGKPQNNSWSSLPQSPQLQQPKARFEAYMMTGDLILNISKAPRVKGPKSPSKTDHQPPKLNKINRNGAIAPHAKYDSSTSTSSEEQLSAKSSKSVVKQTSQEKREQFLQENELLLQDQLENDVSPPSTSSPSSSSPSVNNSSYSNDECPLLRSDERPDGVKAATTSSNGDTHHHRERDRDRPKVSINNTISVSSAEISYSVPTSPISITTANTSELKTKETNSAPTSPDSVAQDFVRRNLASCNLQTQGSLKRKTDVGFRTSRSEDPLQQAQRDGHTIVPIDIDDDFNSSLNTLLDTRDSDGSQSADHERIVWTYNAPIATTTNNNNNNNSHHNNSSNGKVITSPQSNGGSSSHSMSSSPQLVSPTSVSSSVMSSGSKNEATSNDIQNLTCPLTNDQSVSEAVSNISSPDYQDEDNLLMSARDLGAMNISDPSDSDSTILASDKRYSDVIEPNKIVIQVAGGNETAAAAATTSSTPSSRPLSEDLQDSPGVGEISPPMAAAAPPPSQVTNDSPPMSDDSDIDSLHSFHISPKRVDLPSAIRLAKRLYHLDGFRKSDVSKHLSKK